MKKNYSHFIFTLLITCFITKSSGAQPIIEIYQGREHYSIGTSITTFIDESSMLSIDSILKATYQEQFVVSPQKIPNIGITDASLWCKFKIKNTNHEGCYLELANIALDSISIYDVVTPDSISVKNGGSYFNFEDREIQNNNYIFKLCEKTDTARTFYLRVRHSRGTQFPIRVGTLKGFNKYHHVVDFMQGIYFGFMLLMIFYNLFVYFLVRDISYIYYVVYGTCMALMNASLTGYGFEYLWSRHAVFNAYADIFPALLGISGILFATKFLQTKQNTPIMHKVFIGLLVVYAASMVLVVSRHFMLGTLVIEILSLLLILSFFMTAIGLLRKGYKQAKFFLVAWSVLLMGVFVFILKDFDIIPYNALTVYSLQIGSAIEALLLSFALADKINIYKKEKEDAQWQMLDSLKENEKLILSQNQMLETKVKERTALLNQSLEHLKSTQAQLIQSEKLASLGELTAGIAHEIQNPLNFVNNFSELSIELIDELKSPLTPKGGTLEAELLSDISQNLEKINHHGKRASNIVKGMLEHSRISTGERALTDINALADEYLRLSYHGMRAKDKNFNADYKTDFDENSPKIEVIPQDIGRVLLNLINNAFYAVHERNLRGLKNLEGLKVYTPSVFVSTKQHDNQIVISVKDNGTGMPESVRAKVFQPFFTTKPTGSGTGLGLSLAYDIVTKGHGGTLEVISTEGVGSAFIITLSTKIT